MPLYQNHGKHSEKRSAKTPKLVSRNELRQSPLVLSMPEPNESAAMSMNQIPN
jgi:hypothetical protein